MTGGVKEPSAWQRLKRWGAAAVPFVAPWRDGKPRFGEKSASRMRSCGLRRLCNVCGQPLDGVFAFLGGEVATAYNAYHEPPLHEDCLRAALVACPYLAKREDPQIATFARGLRFTDRGANSNFEATGVVRRERIA